MLTKAQEISILQWIVASENGPNGEDTPFVEDTYCVLAQLADTRLDIIEEWDCETDLVPTRVSEEAVHNARLERAQARLNELLAVSDKPMLNVQPLPAGKILHQIHDSTVIQCDAATADAIKQCLNVQPLEQDRFKALLQSLPFRHVPAIDNHGDMQHLRMDSAGHVLCRCPNCDEEYMLNQDAPFWGFVPRDQHSCVLRLMWDLSHYGVLDPCDVATAIVRVTRAGCRYADGEVQGALEEYEARIQWEITHPIQQSRRWWCKLEIDRVRSCWSGGGVSPVYDNVTRGVLMTELRRLGYDSSERRCVETDEDISGELLQDWIGGPTVGVRGKLGAL